MAPPDPSNEESMSTHGCILWLALTSISFDQRGTSWGGGDAKAIHGTESETIAGALDALQTPEYKGVHLNEPEFPTNSYLPYDYYETCADAIDFLIKTETAVDENLLRLAESDQKLR